MAYDCADGVGREAAGYWVYRRLGSHYGTHGSALKNQKRRCYQRRSGAPTRGTGPLRLALAGATRSGTAGVGSP